MRIYRAKDYEGMSRKAANILSAQIILKPNSVIGLATGSSPLGVYKQLVKWYKKDDLDFSAVHTVNLDEYKGLSKEDENSYYSFMKNHLFSQINIPKENINIPNGIEEDERKESERYNNIIKSLGGIDMQLLGLGHNGHIGFNEPGELFEKETHCVKLTKSTIDANKRFFKSEDEMPKFAYTMGIRTIMQARSVLLIVTGESKAEILFKALRGPVTPEVPASVLQLHNNVILVADEAAMSLMNE